MLIDGFSAQAFGTNCWIIAPSPGNECIIVDPGMPLVDAEVEEILSRHNLKPIAIVATHGHLDHTFSIQPLADGYDIPARIHVEDRRLLAEPQHAHGQEFMAMLGGMTFKEPLRVEELRHGDEFSLLDLTFSAIHAPGHTRGSMMFLINGEILISGDVLFKGSIGRTDLPTGSHKDMVDSLKRRVLPLSDEIRVLPGHGAETTIGIERKNNPYLKELQRG